MRPWSRQRNIRTELRTDHSPHPEQQIGWQSHFTMIAGGGIDARISKHFSIRPIQAEYFQTKIPDGLNTGRTISGLAPASYCGSAKRNLHPPTWQPPRCLGKPANGE